MVKNELRRRFRHNCPQKDEASQEASIPEALAALAGERLPSVSTTISSGAVQYLLAGGTASNTTIAGGAYQTDYGSANNTTLSAGALQYVQVGATATSTTVASGAY
jgi:autotransporter passenger strand-loop-strand repeat protein